MMDMDLRTRLIVLVGLIIFVVLATSTIIHIHTLKHHYLEAITWRSEALVQDIVNDLILSAPYLNNVQGLLESKSISCMRLYEFHQDRNVSHCALINASGIIVAHNNKALWNTPIYSPLLREYLQQRQLVTVLVGTSYHTLIPVFGHQNNYLGTIDIGFPKQKVDQKALGIVLNSVGLLGFFFLFSYLTISLLISRILNKPVERLTAVMQAVEHNNFDVEVRIPTRDELGRLADEFNTMRLRLKESFQKHTQLLSQLAQQNERLQKEIAERQQAERSLAEERNLLRTLIDNMPDFIYVKDRASRYLLANTAILRSFGVRGLEDLVGKSDLELMTTDIAERFYQSEQTVMTLGQALINQAELSRDFNTGTDLWILTTKVPFQDEHGTVIGLVGISRDITELKQAEEALHVLNQELEQRVEERTTELREMNQTLKESLETLQIAQNQLVQTEKMAALGSLVAGIAHEINTPIGIGITATSHLEQKTEEIDALYVQQEMKRSDLENYLQTVRQSLGMILGNLRRAANQIKSFKQVAVAQISSEKRSFNLKPYINDVLMSLHPKLRKTSHIVTISCPEHLEIDSYPGAFSQILTNFILNSLLHGFEHQSQGEITIDIQEEQNSLQLCYSDNGRGMAEEERRRVFEPFYTTKQGQGGCGLGLHIVYKLVTQQLGGNITCESAPNVGTRFIIRIPQDQIVSTI